MKFFLTYGDSKYHQSRERIAKEAKETGLFDRVIIKSTFDDCPESRQTEPFIRMPRGGGYWIWKPLIIKQVLDQLEDNDILVYADSGCSIQNTPAALSKWREYFEKIESPTRPMIRFQMGHVERKWTNQAVFQYFGIPADSVIRNSGQYLATVIIMRKCKLSMNIIQKWYQAAVRCPYLFSDMFNDWNADPQFSDHRHDQSVLSVITKIHQDTVWTLPDETYPISDQKAICASRIRG